MSADPTIKNVSDETTEHTPGEVGDRLAPENDLGATPEARAAWRAPLATQQALAKAERIGVRTYPSSEEIIRKMRDSR